MPEFQYTARDATGKHISGRRSALSVEDLASQLQSEACIPIEISRAAQKAEATTTRETWTRFKFGNKKVSQDELQMLCRQMYTILKAGVPIGVGVARLAETARDKYLAHTLQKILVSLNQGRSLYLSLSQFPDIFSPFFVNLVKIGETTGKLEHIFLYLAEYIELEVDTRRKIKAALRYPLMVLVATVVALLVINGLVIPAFSDLFKSFKGILPLPTRILMATSSFLIGYWYVLLMGLIFAIYGLRYYVKTPQGTLNWAQFQLKIPIVGWLIHRIILSRFTRLYALAMRAGITAVESIELVGASTGNAYMSKKIRTIAALVGRGNSIANSIAQTHLFPPLVIQMIALGEETGNIDKLLDDVSDFYQREVAYDLVRLSESIEPIMLVIMAMMVLVLALGVFLPMWDLAGQMQ